MELIWKELEAERLIKREKTQVRIEGDLPSPDGTTPSSVLSVNGKVVIDGTKVGQDEVTVEGRIEVVVMTSDEKGNLSSFESKAAFSHTAAIEGAGPGMNAAVSASIQSLSAEPKDSGARLCADVDLDLRLTTSVPMKVTGGISGVDDLEIRTGVFTRSRRKSLGSDTLRLREEIAADGVSEVLGAEGVVMIRDASIEQGAASVSGVITVTAVTRDASGRVSQLMRQIPFRERIGIDRIGTDVFCSAELGSLYMRALGEDIQLISMEAEVTFDLYSVEKYEQELPLDAFSPTIGFGCLNEDTVILNDLGTSFTQSVIKETVALPDNAPDPELPMYASARPIVTEILPGTSGTEVAGVLATTVVYRSTAGLISVFVEDVPFSTVVGNEEGANMPLISARCTADITGSSDRNMQVQYTLLLETDLLNTEKYSPVVGLAEKETKKSQSGIVIYAAAADESVFDVAKRYSVSCRSVKELNPELEEPFREGDKLILMV